MNLYNLTNKVQRDELKEVEVTIEQGKDYTDEEANKIYNTLISYIFSKSKMDIASEIKKFEDTLNILQCKRWYLSNFLSQIIHRIPN